MPIWNKEVECLSREELKQIQLERLQLTLNRAYENVSFYRTLFDQQGILPEEIRSIEELNSIPFTTRNDLRQAYPYGFFAVSLRQVVRIHATSGTTGESIVVGYTRNDLRNWSELTARVLAGGGVTKDDVVQIAFSYGLFAGAFGYHYGAEKIGASVIPVSSGTTEQQIKILQDFRTTALVCTPSYAVEITELMRDLKIDHNSLALKVGIFSGEPWSDELRREIERNLYISATDNYGLTEVIGPGVAFECEFKNGLHINEDHFVVEVVDPVAGDSLPPGREGELVFTTLTKEAFPLLRYRTGDISALLMEKCPCGRGFQRLRKISGRTDDLIIIKGARFFPAQIENILMRIEGTKPHYQFVVNRPEMPEEIELWVEVSDKFFSDEIKYLEELRRKIIGEIQQILGVDIKVKLVEPKTINRKEGKIKRIGG